MTASTAPRSRRSLLTSDPLILLSLVLLALYFARGVLIPFAMALTLNFLLTPAIMQLERLRVRRVPAVLIVVVMASALAGAVGWIVTMQVIGVVNDLPNYRDNIHEKLGALQPPTSGPLSQTMTSLREIGAELSDTTSEPPAGAMTAPDTSTPDTSTPDTSTPDTSAPNAPAANTPNNGRRGRGVDRPRADTHSETATPVVVVAPPQTMRQYLGEYLLPIVKPLGTLGMVLIFTIYMLLKREDLRNRLLLLAGIGRLNLMTQALNDAAERISRYLVMNVLVNAAYGVIFALGLFLLHVPNATLWGALLAILRTIPYLGTMIGGLATVGYTLAVFNTWWHPLWVFLLFAILEFAVSNFIEPWLYGSHTGISALALVAMALVWTLLWGWPGLVVSTPLTVCLIVLGRYVPQMSFLHILLGEEAALAPEAHFYERLLAMDQSEAHNIAERFLEGHTLVSLYDEVVMPALTMTEQDRHKGILDEVRSSYLFQSATELIAELTDYKSPMAAEAPCPGNTLQSGSNPVVCVPSSDMADEIAAVMFAQLLEQCGHKTLLLPPVALSPEILQRLAQERGTMVCISAVPPFAFAHARNLAIQLRQSLPENHIFVGLWGTNGDMDVLRERFGAAHLNAVVNNLGDALEMVKMFARATPVSDPVLS